LTIADAGPEGYRLQRLLTAWLALVWRDIIEVIPEPDDGEDATVRLKTPSGFRSVEVQSKRGPALVRPQELAEWLAHFPPRAAEGSLLERLQLEPERIAIFVIGGRCNDELDPLRIATPLVAPEPRTALTFSGGRAVQTALTEHATGLELPQVGASTDLRKARAARVRQLALDPFVNEFRVTSRRIFIVEMLSESALQVTLEPVLRERYRVPPGRFSEVLLRLDDEVRRASLAHRDVAHSLAAAVRSFQIDRILRDGHAWLDRPEVASLVETLHRDAALLLTGRPKSGKTWLANWLGQRAQDHGVYVLVGQTPEAAARHLLDVGVVEDRLFILEDPFGSTRLRVDAHERWNVLRDLAERLPSGRRLIVTSRLDLLLALNPTDGEPLGLDSRRWIDVSARSDLFAESLWARRSAESHVPVELIPSIGRLILDAHLQPGQIDRIAAEGPRLAGQSSADVLALARRDAADIGRELSRGGVMRRVLQALWWSADTRSPVRISAMAFALHGGAEEFGLVALGVEPISLARSRTPTEAAVPPKLPIDLSLRDDEREALDELEARRTIVMDYDGYRFRHPDDIEAARQAVLGLQSHGWNDAMARARRALVYGCERMATTVVTRIVELSASLPAGQLRDLRELLRTARRSAFPVVADAALAGMAGMWGVLPPDETGQLLSDINDDARRGSPVIYWTSEGRPFFETRWEKRRDLSRRSEDVLPPMDPSEASEQILWSSMFHDRPPLEWVRRAARSALVETRSRAAKRLFRWGGAENFELMRELLGDSHPRVVALAAEGLVLGWRHHSDGLREDLSALLLGSARRPVVAVALDALVERFRQILGFDVDWYHGYAIPWEFVADLLSAVMAGAPSAHLLNAYRLTGLVDQALVEVAQDRALSLIDAWIGLIERSVALGPVDVAHFTVAAGLLSIRCTDRTPRMSRLARLLAQRDTLFQFWVVCQLATRWAELTDGEQTLVCDLLREPRRDRHWIAAAALCSASSPPPEPMSQALRLGLSRDASEIVGVWNPGVLKNCLLTLRGLGGVSQYTGAKRGEIPLFWVPVIVEASRRTTHPAFSAAVHALMYLAFDSTVQQQWKDLCESDDLSVRRSVHEAFLASVVDDGFWKEAWAQVASGVRADEEEALSEAIAFQLAPYRHEEFWWIAMQQDRLSAAVRTRLFSDLEVLAMSLKPKLSRTSLTRVRQLYGSAAPPQFHETHNRLFGMLGSGQESQEVRSLVVKQQSLAPDGDRGEMLPSHRVPEDWVVGGTD